MLTEAPKFAVIYCRVSSKKQVEEGNGLDSQETRCRDFARMRNYEVLEVFHEEGVSGSLINRPGMQAMLSFLKANRNDGDCIVIIDDISRFARGIEAHWQLRTALDSVGAKLESPSIEFGSDPDSILVENLLASVSQHQRQKNAEQVVNRMQARFKNGYYLANPPAGYRYEKIEGHGKMIVPLEPAASIVKEVLEGFASRRFETQTEVKRFLEKQPDWKKNKHGEVPFRRVEDLLKNPIYAGYMNSRTWKISMQEGKHQPLIDLATWQKNQDRLKTKKVAPIRKDTRPDFPLRGFVCCDECHRPMTACWSKGRSRPYGYYFCQTRDCSQRLKNIR
ncbi:MAG: recombinase family protein, partial [Pseudomonadota bacterium]